MNDLDAALVMSPADGDTFLIDLTTGLPIATYRANTVYRSAACTIGERRFAAAQEGRAAVYIWSWLKDQPVVRCPTAERITQLHATADGVHLIGGSVTGKLYVWEVLSGALLSTWDAHYKSVSCIATSDDESMIFSGSDDGIIRAWNFLTCLDAFRGDSCVPYRSWSDHSLPVTGLFCGAGRANCRLFSSSLDRTCRIWHPASGTQLAVIVMPSPLTCLTVDPMEHTIFTGATDGQVYEATISSAAITGEQGPSCYVRHTGAITSVNVVSDGSLLLSSSADGTLCMWDTFSRQVIKSITQNKGPIVFCQLVSLAKTRAPEGSSIADVPLSKIASDIQTQRCILAPSDESRRDIEIDMARLQAASSQATTVESRENAATISSLQATNERLLRVASILKEACVELM